VPQVKLNLSVWDPLGLALTTTVVAGERADEPLSVPESPRRQASLECRGVPDVGAGKRAALQTRAPVAASGEYSRWPWSSTPLAAVELAGVWAPGGRGEQQLPRICRPADETRPQPQRLAQGSAYRVELTAQVGGQGGQGTERRRVGRSVKLAAPQERAVRQRLAQAQQDIATLNVHRHGKKRVPQAAALQAAAEPMVATPRVVGLLTVRVEPSTTERPRRGSGAHPAGRLGEQRLTVTTQGAAAALATALRRWGWRVSATTQPARQLSLPQAGLASRAE
jgi:hypothetical protein